MFPGERKTEFAGSLSMSGDPELSLSPCHTACGKIGSLLCLRLTGLCINPGPPREQGTELALDHCSLLGLLLTSLGAKGRQPPQLVPGRSPPPSPFVLDHLSTSLQLPLSWSCPHPPPGTPWSLPVTPVPRVPPSLLDS